MPPTAAQRLIAVLRCRFGSCECAVALSGIAGGCSAAGDGPRPNGSTHHDETAQNQRRPPCRAAGEDEEGRNRAAG